MWVPQSGIPFRVENHLQYNFGTAWSQLSGSKMARLQPISVCILIMLSSYYPRLTVSQSTVRYLPGFSGPLPFRLETGYVGVGDLEENQLFYYFVESEKSPKEDPLVLWLIGGPGCSGWSALVYEIGPLSFENVPYNGTPPTLKLRQHSWTKISNIIFVDSPVWTGFSYSSGSKDYSGGDIKSSKEVHQFLRKWLIAHPQFLSNPLYVGGESYSGITLPIVVHEIANGIDAGQEPILNLKTFSQWPPPSVVHTLNTCAILRDPSHSPARQEHGYLLGNPITDRVIDGGSFVPYARGMGLISAELYKAMLSIRCADSHSPLEPKIDLKHKQATPFERARMGHPLLVVCEARRFLFAIQSIHKILLAKIKSTKKSCRGHYTKPSNFKCTMDLEAVNKCIAGIYTDHILEPKCPLASPKPKDTVGHGRSLKENSRELLLPDPLPTFGCREYWQLLSYYWADDASVRKALHIREGTIGEWLRCNRKLAYVYDVNSSVKYHLNLTTRGYRALIYSGDHDLGTSFVGTETWIRSLNFSIVDDWQPWAVDGQVAGYTRTYSNDFTFATVKGAGHMAPEYKPKECFAMFQRWISHNPL
ncbi:serine carboxypeptidase-like 17 isoform X2 [Magnolia sinica]|uniref:serine carboxypeptidase-like 17 isoform X2 n=1 Tax=Magnolia sinica TaxID=86752 RepID=UPI002659C8DD|nr:serine carboxypeptidase-like 17 isoform X2 [Magnolia sinica]